VHRHHEFALELGLSTVGVGEPFSDGEATATKEPPTQVHLAQQVATIPWADKRRRFAPDSAPWHQHGDPRRSKQFQRHVEAGGEHRQVTPTDQMACYLPSGGARVEHDGLAIGDEFRCRRADALLGFDALRLTHREGECPVSQGHRHSAPVGAGQAAGALQGGQVRADGHRRDAQLLAESCDGNATIFLQPADDNVPPLLAKQPPLWGTRLHEALSVPFGSLLVLLMR